MSKGAKRFLIVIVIAIVVLAIIWIVYEANKPEPASINAATELPDENKGIDNIINDFVENEVVSEEDENANEDATAGEKEEVTDTNSGNSSSELMPGTNESREERAVELAKEYYEEKYGSLDGIYFRCDSVYKDGRYVVTVTSGPNETLAFLYVDLRTELVEER
jgi:cbb3-type cytochrome oxidase subunit 3